MRVIVRTSTGEMLTYHDAADCRWTTDNQLLQVLLPEGETANFTKEYLVGYEIGYPDIEEKGDGTSEVNTSTED